MSRTYHRTLHEDERAAAAKFLEKSPEFGRGNRIMPVLLKPVYSAKFEKVLFSRWTAPPEMGHCSIPHPGDF
jgi:hypothetical protein